MIRVSFESPKGGQGLSTTICGLAVAAADFGDLVSIQAFPDIFAICGMSDPVEGYDKFKVNEHLYIHETGDIADIIVGENLFGVDKRYLVIQPCYLALHRAMKEAPFNEFDGVITFDMPGRALNSRDVGDVLNLEVIGTIPWDEKIARQVDAGIFTFTRKEMQIYANIAKKVFA